MTLTIQLREEDLQEANANAYVQKNRQEQWKARLGLIGWFVFVVVASFLFLLLRGLSSAPASPDPLEPAFDLMLALLPSTVAAIWFLALVGVSLILHVQVVRTRAAFGEAGYAKFKKSKWVWVLVVVALGSVASLLYVPAIEWRAGRSLALLLAFVPWLFALFALRLIVRRYNQAVMQNQWQRTVSLHGPIAMEMDEMKVRSRTADIETTYRWSAFLRFRETENIYVLVTQDSEFIMVPKRDLNAQGAMMEFRALIQSHIAEGYFLTLPGAAFPVVRPASLPPPPLERKEMRQG